ncbi:hypothetical protein Fcan01_24091 [Folsomia candida]|uniref:Uncharacterized protein n=1 Tax=Folsomia candida TaxID=158441 RepID=A0A226D8E0_FOLCA|nr:hypothetical protein Fcan01_24091 [Folsomia candida]
MGRHKDLSAKAMVVKLVNYFKNEKKLFRKRSAEASWNIAKRFRQRAIDALNISAATVTRCLAENRETGKSISPRKQGNSGRKGIIVDSFTEGVIRRKILEGYTQKKFYTVKRLYEVLQEDPNFPKFKSYRTLHKIMRKQLKFKFVKFHSKPIPFERHDVQVARHSFLRSIRKLRRENYNIFYTDETWANENQSPSKGWHLQDCEVLGVGNNATHVDQWLKGVGRRFADKLIGAGPKFGVGNRGAKF